MGILNDADIYQHWFMKTASFSSSTWRLGSKSSKLHEKDDYIFLFIYLFYILLSFWTCTFIHFCQIAFSFEFKTYLFLCGTFQFNKYKSRAFFVVFCHSLFWYYAQSYFKYRLIRCTSQLLWALIHKTWFVSCLASDWWPFGKFSMRDSKGLILSSQVFSWFINREIWKWHPLSIPSLSMALTNPL